MCFWFQAQNDYMATFSRRSNIITFGHNNINYYYFNLLLTLLQKKYLLRIFMIIYIIFKSNLLM